jgi:hypothetical protein
MELPEVVVNGSLLSLVAGAMLSLLVSYVPGFDVRFAGLDPTRKRLLMAGLLLLTTVGIAVLSVTGVWVLIPPVKNGWIVLVLYFFMTLLANQNTYQISPVTKRVEKAKARRNIDASGVFPKR